MGDRIGSVCTESFQSVCREFLSRIASFWKRSPLYANVSRNVIFFPEISAVNLIIGKNCLLV